MVTHDNIAERLDRGDDRFASIEAFMVELGHRQGVIEGKLDTAIDKIADVRKATRETREIIEAWRGVKTVGRGLKWLGGIAAALAAVVAFAKSVAAHVVWGLVR